MESVGFSLRMGRTGATRAHAYSLNMPVGDSNLWKRRYRICAVDEHTEYEQSAGLTHPLAKAQGSFDVKGPYMVEESRQTRPVVHAESMGRIRPEIWRTGYKAPECASIWQLCWELR